MLPIVFHCKRQRTKHYIPVPLTFADHIRKKRLEMRLTFPELAALLGVSETSIWGWETGKSIPLISVYPKIISFLGYAPFPTDNLNFGERLSTARHIAGITRKELARMLRMGAETLQDIENTNCVPKPKVYYKLQPFIEQQFAQLPELISLSN